MAKSDLLDRLAEAGSVDLATLTDEELESVSADEGTPFRPAVPPEVTRSLPDDVRGLVHRTALRSLIVRGLVREPEEQQLTAAAIAGHLTLEALGDLDPILKVRRIPTAVLFVGQEAYLAVLHGFQEERVGGFLEEHIDRRGFHRFTLRTAENTVEELVRVVDPGGLTPAMVGRSSGPRPDIPEELSRELRELGPGVTRLDAYHLRAAGTRRTQVSIAVTPDGTSVVGSTFGVAPEPPRRVTVDRGGLRTVILAVLDDQDELWRELDSDEHRHHEQLQPERPTVTRSGHQCPVCGYADLHEPPYVDGGASYEICPSCGMEFGYDDQAPSVTFETWRAKWISDGMRWSSRGVAPPPGWDPRAQLRTLGIE